MNKHQLLFAFGFFCLVTAGCLGTYVGMTVAEQYGQARAFTEHSVYQNEPVSQKTTQDQEQLGTVDWEKPPKNGSKIAQLNIPDIHVSVPVYMGVSDTELSTGVGLHDMAFPGEKGRIALAGHRETAFAKADQLQTGDRFELKTPKGIFTYQIRESRIVDAEDRSIVVETDHPEAVLYTCWPLQFGAPTEKRLVFFADMVDSQKTE